MTVFLIVYSYLVEVFRLDLAKLGCYSLSTCHMYMQCIAFTSWSLKRAEQLMIALKNGFIVMT